MLWLRHRFQIASFWPSTLGKQRFQTVPFSNSSTLESVFADRFRRCSVDVSRIRNKTVSFSFENGIVWTGFYSCLFWLSTAFQRSTCMSHMKTFPLTCCKNLQSKQLCSCNI